MKSACSSKQAGKRLSMEFGICIAKLAARLKFVNDYKPLDKEKELAEIEKLRGFREV